MGAPSHSTATSTIMPSGWLRSAPRMPRRPPAPAPPVVSKPNPQALAAQQTLRRTLQKEIDKLEKQIAAWQTELGLLESRLADPVLYANPDQSLALGLQKRQGELSRALEQAEERWLAQQEELEGLPAA